MKQILIIGFIFLVSKGNAQIPPDGSCVTNNTMSAFHGTWQWVSGTDTFKLNLAIKKTFIEINGGFYQDLLIG